MMQQARRNVSESLDETWMGLREFTYHPLTQLRNGISLSLETIEGIQIVGVNFLEELAQTAAQTVGLDKDKTQAGRTTSRRSAGLGRCAIM